ncbi:MAG: phytanoyl-CoA dioxygenase family protein, partial [Acetobacteraceae bacterium]
MQLDRSEIGTFNREGFLFFTDVFTPAEVELLAEEAIAIFEQEREEIWREKSGAPRTAFAAHTYNEGFRRLGAHPRLIRPVEQIFG